MNYRDRLMLFFALYKLLYIFIIMEQPLIDHDNLKNNLNSNSRKSTLLTYTPSLVEGQCILKEIKPILKHDFKCMLFNIFACFLLGIPFLVCQWYPQIKYYLFFEQADLEQCSHFYIRNYDESISIVENQEQFFSDTTEVEWFVISFTNRYMKYLVIQNQVKAAVFDYQKRIQQIVHQQKKYLHQKDVKKLTSSFGPGTMILQQPGLLKLLVQEILRPLYLFIIFSLIFWVCTEYYQYAIVIFVTTSFGLIVNLFQIKSLNKKIYDMAYSEVQLKVFRQGKVLTISSINIVPGDVVFIKNPIKLPFQGVILEGAALINECALTGESVPVLKKATQLLDCQDNKLQIDKSSYVYEGTTVIKVDCKKKMKLFEAQKQYGVPICVIRTNFSTMKGQLIRIILFPKVKSNPFQNQSSKFLIFLFFVAILSYGALVIKLHNVVSIHNLIMKIIDLITITVPPGLPVSMTFGIIFALDKLKNKQIYCTSPGKVICGGRVDFACFDKTGTLTQDFMDFHGVLPCHKNKFELLIEADCQSCEDPKSKQEIQDILYKIQMHQILANMASNHTLVHIESQKKLIGDPMEVKLFEFGQFQIDSSITDPQIIFAFNSCRKHHGKVYKRFDFDSNLLRMSVICKSSFENVQSQQLQTSLQVYSKGSPQKMLQIMNKSSIPIDYFQKLKEYTSHGFRVLAIASKYININQSYIRRIKREQIQNSLDFNGFQIFQNKLKPQTFDTIKQLNDASIRSIMVTGDNALTACNISFKCQISNIHKKIIIIDYHKDTFQYTQEDFVFIQSTQKSRKSYKDKNRNSQFQLQKTQIQMSQIPSIKDNLKIKIQASKSKQIKDSKSIQIFMNRMIKRACTEHAQLCLTGNIFQKIFQFIISSEFQSKAQLIQQFISCITVYARAKPNDKIKVVSIYQRINKIVIMCGDGANDCGALKQADVGLSLSQCQASISAPFTSKIINISSVVQLIKQCRAGLATNFSLFNIMAMYSLIQYSSSIIIQFYYAYPSRAQYLYWDLAGNFFFFLTFGYTQTIQKLNKYIPKNSLFSYSNIMQLLFMFFLQLFGQILMIVAISGPFSSQADYYLHGGQQVNRQRYQAQGQFISNTPQTDIIFLFANFMYIFSLIAFSVSKPWRKQFYTNIPFMMVLIAVLTYSIVLCVIPALRLKVFQINWMNYTLLNTFVLICALMIGGCMYLFQKFIFQPCAFRDLHYQSQLKKQ